MHEFSIVQNIVEIAIETASQNHVKSVRSVEVEIGQASGIVADAMDFAWESLIKDTPLRQASLVIKIIPLVVKCVECGLQYSPQEIYEPCRLCGALNPEILSGKELRVTAIQT